MCLWSSREETCRAFREGLASGGIRQCEQEARDWEYVSSGIHPQDVGSIRSNMLLEAAGGIRGGILLMLSFID